MTNTQGRNVVGESLETVAASGNSRRYSSPNRVLVRSFRISRDGWKNKHQAGQIKLEQQRQLAADRGRARDRWMEKCEVATTRAVAAEVLAQQRLKELEQARVQLATLQADKKKHRRAGR